MLPCLEKLVGLLPLQVELARTTQASERDDCPLMSAVGRLSLHVSLSLVGTCCLASGVSMQSARRAEHPIEIRYLTKNKAQMYIHFLPSLHPSAVPAGGGVSSRLTHEENM